MRGLVAELAERGLKVDYRTVWNFVHGEKPSFKKAVLASEQDRKDVARRREQWKKYQTRIDPARLAFIGETWTKTNRAPLRGWAPRGKRLRNTGAHTIDALYEAIGQLPSAFPPEECTNYFKRAGYALT